MGTVEVGSFRASTCQAPAAGRFCPQATLARARLIGPSHIGHGRHRKAKSILLVWLGGGPSHLDLFDPKPKAPAEYRGPFTTIATRTPGVRFTELLPKLAARSHKFSLVRSNVNFHDGHREAGSIALTGAAMPRPRSIRRTSARSSRGSGATTHLPRFISLARGPIGDGVGPIQGSGGGTWGQGHRPVPDRLHREGPARDPQPEAGRAD